MRASVRLTVAGVIAATLVLTSAVPASAAPTSRKYRNCAAVHEVYSGGIAKPGVKYNTVSGRKKAIKGVVKTDRTLYERNAGLDRDRDGIACELS